MADGLTPKQEAFAQAYVETGNASEAYRRAYDAGEMKRTSLVVEASRMLDHPNVALRIGELRGEAFQRHEMTVSAIAAMLMEDRDLAHTVEAPSAAATASMGLAKLYGLITEKRDITNSDGTLAREPRYNLVDKGGPKP